EREHEHREETRRHQCHVVLRTDEAEGDADPARDDGKAQGRGLQEPGADQLASTLSERTVQHGWNAAHSKHRRQEDGDTRERGAALDETFYVELEASRDEEEGDEHPEANRLQLRPEHRMSAHLVTIDELEG